LLPQNLNLRMGGCK